MPAEHLEWAGATPDEIVKSRNDALLGALNSAIGLFKQPYVPFHNNVGHRFKEGINTHEQDLQNLLAQKGVANPFIERAQELRGEGQQSFPGQMQNYMNPYTMQVANRMAEMGNRNFNENLMPALEAKFVRLGQHGGRQHRDMAARLARDVQANISSQQGNLLHQGYGQGMEGFNQDMNRKLHAAELESKLGALKQAALTSEAGLLGEAGKHARYIEERPMAKAEEEHRRAMNHQSERLALLASIANGTPITGPTRVQDSPESFHGSDWGGLAERTAARALSAFSGQPTTNPAPVERRKRGGPIQLNHYAPQYAHGGLVKHEKTGYIRESDSGGQDDDIDMAIQPNAYVWNATDVSLLGDGNTETGIKKLKEHEANKIAEYERRFARSGITAPYDNSHAIKAKVSNGEYVMDARAVCAEGNGDIRKGVKAIDKGRKLLRKQKGVKSILPPKANNINSYVKGR